MTKTELNDFGKKISGHIKTWSPKLFLHDWNFHIKEGDPNSELALSGAVLSVDPNSTYLEANIYIYPNLVVVPEARLEEVVLHELIHCLQAELIGLFHEYESGRVVNRKQKIDAVERLTQRMTKIIIRKEPTK